MGRVFSHQQRWDVCILLCASMQAVPLQPTCPPRPMLHMVGQSQWLVEGFRGCVNGRGVMCEHHSRRGGLLRGKWGLAVNLADGGRSRIRTLGL